MHQKKKINPSPSSEPQIHVNKNSSRNPEPIITKLPSFTP